MHRVEVKIFHQPHYAALAPIKSYFLTDRVAHAHQFGGRFVDEVIGRIRRAVSPEIATSNQRNGHGTNKIAADIHRRNLHPSVGILARPAQVCRAVMHIYGYLAGEGSRGDGGLAKHFIPE